MPENSSRFARRLSALMAAWLLAALFSTSARAQAITNLQQLTQAVGPGLRINRDVHLDVTVCAASRPAVGVLIVKDNSGVELLELGEFQREIQPGDRLRITGWYCLLRKREMGIELSATAAVNNDGAHVAMTWPGTINLKAGKNPLRLEWFNCLRDYVLEVSCACSNEALQPIASSNLCHAVVDASGHTNFLPGLRAEGYEGYWETVPDFELYNPVKTGIVTNFDLGFRPRNEMVAIRFSGYFDAPRDGTYQFRVRSDDGSLLFLAKPELPLLRLGSAAVPAATPGLYGEAMQSLSERRWIEMQGRVTFVSRKGKGLEFDLRSDRDIVSVRVADAVDLDAARLLNSQVKIRGVAQGVLTTDRRIVLGKVFVASEKEITFAEPAAALPALPITTVAGVQNLPIEEARKSLPVRIRGVVTDAKNSTYNRWISIQDDTRGIFVSLTSVSNNPAFGDFWEIEGHSGAGDFAPVIIADKMTFLGNGRVPLPARPTWNELVNGSRDVQWAELVGLVTAVQSNTVTLLLPEGQLEVRMDDLFESDLRPYIKSVVRLRGVLYAMWDADTREVRVGNVMMRNASIDVDIPAPSDPFAAPVKTARELFLFDPHASAFQRIKVRGQVVYADARHLFAMDDGMGVRILPVESETFHPGDVIEAVGYPEISGPSPLLREAVVRKTGDAPLPAPRSIQPKNLTESGLDATRVLVDAKLVGLHSEQDTLVLEMQSSNHLFFARLEGIKNHSFLEVGSRLRLTGVYVGQGSSRRPGKEIDTFEMLLNSPNDVTVVSQPPWWTLQRLLTVVGLLLVILMVAAAWITLLRRQVEQRTRQLQHEIGERERVEHQHELEAERARIARDLHDDLGSSLTEISVLASTGLRHDEAASAAPADLRPPPEATGAGSLFHTIATKARSLIAALDVIVWAVDPEDNSLQSLADYLSGYTEEFFSHTEMSCRFKVPVSFPAITLEGRVRHDLLMAVKEALNNVVRHAEAAEVEFRMAMVDHTLEIEITDNGKGFEGKADKDGHGLKNLPARLKKIGGDCTIESRVGGGTTVRIRLPLPVSAAGPN